VGDPGTPVMLALLAVPVGVLLFVVVLALMGGRWPAPLTETDPGLDLDVDLGVDLGLDPGPAEQPTSSGWERAALPAPERALPAAPSLAALPPARPRYGAYSRDTYGPQEEDDTSSSSAFPYGPYRYQ
jgi:hypothetical protein